MKRESYPEPQQILEYIADACDQMLTQVWKSSDIPIGMPWPEAWQIAAQRINLADIIEQVSKRMAERNERFTSDYRHECTPLHRTVYALLAHGTVQMNRDMDDSVARKNEVKA
jgi:hypothetical protein